LLAKKQGSVSAQSVVTSN